MSEYNFDGKVSVSDNTIANSSSSDWQLNIGGDTVRIVNPRIPSPTTDGNPGEICWGSNTVLGITSYYICVCVATNTWRYALLGASL